MAYCMYLRKSRADAEAEARGEGETLARHEKMLMDLARRQKLNVTKVYKEIVSGETIAARPVMQQLLTEVEDGAWDGVLVVEVERLARGNTLDQGLVSQAFQYSCTKIYTPLKTYDPNNEFDSEYFEFGLFMSRREYKTINRRLQNGRLTSVNEGKYVGNKPPYGYARKKIDGDKGYTLDIIPEQAEAVKLAYDLYVNHGMGPHLIADELDRLGYRPLFVDHWSPQTIRGLLENPVYIGKIRWGGRAGIKSMHNGKLQVSRPRNQNPTLCDGLHDAIISEDIYYTAQKIRTANSRPRCKGTIIKNPLAGIIVCGICGHNMSRRPYPDNTKDTLLCPDSHCTNVSSYLWIVEEELLKAIDQYLSAFRLQLKDLPSSRTDEKDQLKQAITRYESELKTLDKQFDSLHDFLEQGIYTTETFLDRSAKLEARQQDAANQIVRLKSELKQKESESSPEKLIPVFENILDTYWTLETPKERNELLKSGIEKVIYTKPEGGRYKGKERAFTLEIYPRRTFL
ncbi:recombinase family protein [Anaerovorax odorimutans]|uniref:Recombinase family protein n=1 Tax=Anaerovorax odorimutans TaxID=109327 RepID=A0ABT1RRC2_9FIRM|nr:recombinase family protein [Anaerovorax odorimutans]MCQ4637704.1 recombinase family protein [Anaerovorax odorimutans]